MKKAEQVSPLVLLADDQPDILEALRMLLKGEGYRTEVAHSPAQALSRLDENDFELALIDLNYSRDTTSGQEGLDLLGRFQALDSTLPVVVMTAWGNVELAVEAMRRGARDFIQKPWDNTRLLTIVRTQVELGRALRLGRRLEAENRRLRGEHPPQFIAQSKVMQPVLRMIEQVGPSDANVLITGDNGTGKGMVAQAIHAVSARAHQPFVPVNLGGLAEGVFESELFGHVKGAFTDAKSDRLGRFELAQGGTLFLDEIANVPLTYQPKLLRVVETGEFERVGSAKTLRADVRLLAATNADLHAAVAAGRFRQDLWFRLNTVEIRLPPLRERPEDIPSLAVHFLQHYAAHHGRPVTQFDEPALRWLLHHPWPGNVRELSHLVERAVLLATGPTIRPSDLASPPATAGTPSLEEMDLDSVERVLIQKALRRSEGNVVKAAEALGLSRSAFYRRLQKYGL